MELILSLISLAVAIFQFMAYLAGTEIQFGWGFWLSFGFLIVVGGLLSAVGLRIIWMVAMTVLAYIGATKGWGWEWWQAVLLVSPGVCLTIVLAVLWGFGSIFRGFR